MDSRSPAQIVAFATFMPEITSPHRQVYERARNALKFLVEVATNLATPARPFTIELVTGGLLQGVWIAKTAHGNSFAVNKLNSAPAVTRFLDHLQPVASFAQEKNCGIQLALELEPGPLFTMGGWDSLQRLCQILANPETDRALRSIVGVNLDIPHWHFLAGIDVNCLEKAENEYIRRRIIHAHISDHANGHFADNVIGMFHPDEFRIWTEFLARLQNEQRPANCPRYSGLISCEMESCKQSSFLNDSVSALKKLVRGQK